jgi:HK97 gp10 family phage protein
VPGVCEINGFIEFNPITQITPKTQVTIMVEKRGEIKLQGFDELRRALMEMPEKIRKKTLRAAQRNAAKVIADAAGNLLGSAGTKKDMTILIRAYRDRVRALVGPKTKKWYLKFREFGTSLHKVTASGSSLSWKLHKARAAGGKSPAKVLADKDAGIIFGKEVQVQMSARPFLRPAFDSHKQEYLDTLGMELKKSIEETFKKHLKQGGR